jgi:hypothetical protein
MSRQERTIDDRELDLLVDGELNETERRELLARLETQPESWRRCALAFLEAQSWRGDLGVIARPPRVEPVAPPVVPPPVRKRPVAWTSVLAVAASFVLAFALGVVVRPAWRGAIPGLDQVASQTRDSRSGKPGNELQGDPAAPWRMVTLTGTGPSGDPIRLPAVESNRLDDAWLRSLPAAVPPDVLRAFERTGHSVRQSRQLMPVPMEDGRRLVVPVDQVEVRPAARYQ